MAAIGKLPMGTAEYILLCILDERMSTSIKRYQRLRELVIPNEMLENN